MTKHTLMLHTGKAEIASPGLRQVVSLIQSGAPMADTAAANVATLQADAGGPPPPKAADFDVKYLEDGTIDWAVFEDDYFLPLEDDREFDCEVMKLECSDPQSCNLHPYFHPPEDTDCIIIGHKCNCMACRYSDPGRPEPPVARPLMKTLKADTAGQLVCTNTTGHWVDPPKSVSYHEGGDLGLSQLDGAAA